MKFNLFQSKNFRKKIALLLCISIVFNSVFLPLAYAEETSQTDQQSAPAPENTSDSQAQSTSPPPTETPAPTSEIQTGDATSQASTDTTANYTETTTQGNVTSEGCNVEVDLNCNPSSTKVAEVGAETESTSTTGVNNIEGAQGDAVIGTGDAVSQATDQNLLNTNIVEATEEAEIEDINNDSGVVPTEVGTPQNDGLNIEMDNSATLEATASAESTSGQNSITEAGGDATITSGDSIAQADLANLVNTNILGSNFEFFLLPVSEDQTGDINLLELWNKLQQKIAENSADLTSFSNVNIINSNEALINLFANASAVSGQNSAGDNAGGATINTGDSIASANIFNLINLNILGSNFLFGVINIYGNLTGHIVVPSPYRFLEYLSQTGLYDGSLIKNQNYALVSSSATSLADSGSNSQTGESLQAIETGNAYAYSSSTNIANLNLMMANWYFLLLNNFGFWDGTVDSWENPASRAAQAEESATYQLDNPTNQTFGIQGENAGGASVLNKNSVVVNAGASATAISGQNRTWNNLFSLIRTGRSLAMANVFNFLNTNIIGSNFFMPIINLFGSWKGNLIFAHPDMRVTMSADKPEVTYGDNLNYTVSYENIGYEEARNVTLNIDLPGEARLNAVSGPKFAASGNHLQFFVGDVAAKKGGSFNITVDIQRPTSSIGKNNLLAKIFEAIVRPVDAAENGRQIVTSANIATPDPETDLSQNNFSVVTILVTPEVGGESTEAKAGGVDPGLEPALEAASSNNTGEYVNPGDEITFFATVKNTGLGRALKTVVYQDIFYQGMVVVRNKFDLGEIEGGKKKKLTFNVKVPKKAIPGVYQSIIYADAESTYGKIFSSNESVTEFRVKGNSLVQGANEKKDGVSVLAAESIGNTAGANSMFNNLLYLLVFVFSLLWYVEYVRRKDAEEKLDLFLKKPEKKVEKSFQVQSYPFFRRILRSISTRRPLLGFKL